MWLGDDFIFSANMALFNTRYNPDIDGNQEETLRGIGDWILESTQCHTAAHPQEICFSIGDDGDDGRDDNGGDDNNAQ